MRINKVVKRLLQIGKKTTKHLIRSTLNTFLINVEPMDILNDQNTNPNIVNVGVESVGPPSQNNFIASQYSKRNEHKRESF